MIRERSFSTLDLNFLGTALVIAAIGCMLIYSATYFGDPGLQTLRKQVLWVGIGIVSMIFVTYLDLGGR